MLGFLLIAFAFFAVALGFGYVAHWVQSAHFEKFMDELTEIAAYFGLAAASNCREGGEDSEQLINATSHADFTSVELTTTSKRKSTFQSIEWSNILTFFVNGTKIELVNPDPTTLTTWFIRENLGLKGTKLGCEEGGCGACTVVLTRSDGTISSVNSCLRLLCLNDGMCINTIESIGSLQSGLSTEQQRIVATNGTQCGYCTPGWITTMHALSESADATGTTFSRRDIEKYLDGNICRCTGYHPILEAFGTLATAPGQASASGSASCCSNNKSKAAHTNCAGLCYSKDNCPGTPCLPSDMEDGLCGLPKPKTSVSGPGTKSKPLGRKRDLALISSYVPQPTMYFNPITNKRWIRPVQLDQLCAVLSEFRDSADKIQLVGGNTSIGVTKYFNDSEPFYVPDQYDIFIDINCISPMVSACFDRINGELSLGATLTINTVIATLRKYSPSATTVTTNPSCQSTDDVIDHRSVFAVTANHLSRVANTQVRNAGSWAGNLMIFLRHSDFPSDILLALTTANAKLQVCSFTGDMQFLTMEQFMAMSYDQFVSQGLFIMAMIITEPSLIPGFNNAAKYVLSETFKICTRPHNAHAQVNAGFQWTLLRSPLNNTAPICLGARMVFGGVSAKTFIAKRAMAALSNARIDRVTLDRVLYALNQDLADVGASTAYGDQAFRESVMQACVYRTLLRCFENDIPQYLYSAVAPWVLPESRGVELFLPSPPDAKAAGKPIKKLEAPMQATGQAMYPSDVVQSAQGLHAAIVYSSQCAVQLASIDVNSLSSLAGVVTVLTAADIPGENTVGKDMYLFVPIGAEVKYVGEPLAVVIAETEAIANQAVAKIQVTYASLNKTPIISLDQAIAARSFFKFPSHIPGVSFIRKGDPESVLVNGGYRKVRGHINAGGQTHFYMEAQVATATILDGSSITVVCGTQDPTKYQGCIAATLGVPVNKVVVECPRVGGAFGGKLSRGITNAVAAALCATKVGRSVRIFNTRTADSVMIGSREGWAFDYEVAFSSDGKIQALKYEMYADAGAACTDTIGSVYMGMNWADNAYYIPNYSASAQLCFTNTPPRTSMRAPGVVQTCFATEVVIERVAHELGLPTRTVQEANFIKDGDTTIVNQTITNCKLQTVWETLLSRCQYNDRLLRVQQYNASNLWRKRGISITPVKYGIGWSGYNAGVRLGVSTTDGTVTLTHSGSEIGQGINTKVAQAVASALGIDHKLIRVTATATDKVVNGGLTGGSGTSEVTCQAALNACATLNARLDPFRTSDKYKTAVQSNEEWQSLVQSVTSDISLNVEGWYSPTQNPNGQAFQYFVYLACCSEVELDVLSGNVQVLSTEVVYDCGQSLNPAIDIGQIEGGIVMGLGYFVSERVEWDSNTGIISTPGTWEYKPPLLQDIPRVLNITLLKNDYNTEGILGSKATAEPPFMAANSFFFAIKMAIAAARADAGVNEFLEMDAPATIDVRQRASLVNPHRFVMPN